VFQQYCFLGQCFVFQEITKLQEHTFKNFLSIHCCSNQEKCCLLWCLRRIFFYVIERCCKNHLLEMFSDMMDQGHIFILQ